MGNFRTLNTAVSGLQAAQANLYVSGHNMSNVNTAGYTRQQVIQSDSYYNSIGKNSSGILQVGLGTNVQSIRQIRNKFLDAAYRSSTATMNFYNTAYNVGLEVETTFGELEGEYKLQSVLMDLKNSLSELSNDPAGLDTRGEFISTCVTFVDKVNDTYNDLVNQQKNINNEIINMTSRINELVYDINKYGELISFNETSGDNANDYRDAINLALDELSGYLAIDYKINANHTVNIFCEGGPLLLNGVQSELGLRYCAPLSELVEPVFTGSKDILRYDDLTPRTLFNYSRDVSSQAKNDGGALKGLLVSRGLRQACYLDSEADIRSRYSAILGGLNSSMGGLDSQIESLNTAINNETNTAAKQALEDELSRKEDQLASLQNDYNLYSKQYEKDLWNMKNCLIPKTQLSLDSMVKELVTLINDTFAPKDVYNSASYPGDYPYGLDGSQKYMEIFVRKGSDYQGASSADPIESGYAESIFGYDYYSLYTIGNFQVNPELKNASSYSDLTLSKSGDPSDNRLILDILEKWDSALVSVNGSTPLSIELFYRQMVSDLSVEISSYRTVSESEYQMLLQTDNARMSHSGVSLDEEMTDMLRFQHAYNAAARVLNYVDSMINTVINSMGRVGL